MLSAQVLANLNPVINDCLAKSGYELVELIARSEKGGLVLVLLVDKPQGGITLGECIKFGRALNLALAEKNIVSGDYSLEVASPGLDRPLKTIKDYLRCLNKEALFFLNDLVGGKSQWQGYIKKVAKEVVVIDATGISLSLPLEKISQAKLVI